MKHSAHQHTALVLVQRLRDSTATVNAHFNLLLTEAADRIEHLEAALREPDRVARIIRNVAEWTPEARRMLVKEILTRWSDDYSPPRPR